METITELSKNAGCTKQEYARRYFEEHDCRLIDEYCHTMKPMKFVCSCGRTSHVSWNKFTQRGDKCGYCHETGRKRKYTVDEVRAVFAARGCEFLDHDFRGIKHNHRYRCKCGRKTTISFSGFYHQHQSCHQCGLEKNRGPGHHDWISDREKKRENDLFRKKCYKALASTLEHTKQRKHNRTHVLLGYTHAELREYIQSHPNYEAVKNSSWHLAHIFPIAAFIEHGINNIRIINALNNLQPLPGKENISKSDTYDKEAFLAWLKTKQV